MHVAAAAGHVDRGKSTLVRALTGMEPDRFAEERRRGTPPVMGHVDGDRTLLDLRSLPPAADDDLAAAVLGVAAR